MNTDDVGKIHSRKELVHNSADLQDSEAQEAIQIIVGIQNKYARRANTVKNLEALRDEVLTRFMEVGILATFDPTPCFYGEAPVLEILGKVGASTSEFDHERKSFEVQKAAERGEQYLGEKEAPNASVAKKRDKRR